MHILSGTVFVWSCKSVTFVKANSASSVYKAFHTVSVPNNSGHVAEYGFFGSHRNQRAISLASISKRSSSLPTDVPPVVVHLVVPHLSPSHGLCRQPGFVLESERKTTKRHGGQTETEVQPRQASQSRPRAPRASGQSGQPCTSLLSLPHNLADDELLGRFQGDDAFLSASPIRSNTERCIHPQPLLP